MGKNELYLKLNYTNQLAFIILLNPSSDLSIFNGDFQLPLNCNSIVFKLNEHIGCFL